MTMVMSGKRTAQSTETMQQDNAKTLHPIMCMNESWICLAHHTKLVPWQALGLVVAEFKLQGAGEVHQDFGLGHVETCPAACVLL